MAARLRSAPQGPLDATYKRGLLLAGGLGTRLGRAERSNGGPKILVELGIRTCSGGATLLCHQLETFRTAGVDRVVVNIAGRFQDRLTQEMAGWSMPRARPDVDIDIEQTPLGVGQAFCRLLCGMRSPTLVLLGDIYLGAGFARPYQVATSDVPLVLGAVVLTADERAQSCAIEVDDHGRVERIEERPGRIQGGLAWSGSFGVHPSLLPTIERVLSHEPALAWGPLGTVFDRVMASGTRVGLAREQAPWCNVNTGDDLAKLRRLAARSVHLGQRSAS